MAQKITHGYMLSPNLQEQVPELCWDQVLSFVLSTKDIDLG